MIYIAGPLTNADPAIQAANIDRAQRAYYALLEVGLTAICPHLSGTDVRAFHVSYEAWIRNGLAQLALCDAIWLLPCWHHSNGALLELAEARRQKTPKVFYRFEDVCVYHGLGTVSRWWNDTTEYTTCLPA